MAKEHQWDVYLRPNVLTKDDENDCIADVLTRLQTRRRACSSWTRRARSTR